MFPRGRSQPFEKIPPEQYLENPIWEMALDGEEDNPDCDESWRRPVLGATDLTEDMPCAFAAFWVSGTELLATALWDPSEDGLNELLIWSDGVWKTPKETPAATPPHHSRISLHSERRSWCALFNGCGFASRSGKGALSEDSA